MTGTKPVSSIHYSSSRHSSTGVHFSRIHCSIPPSIIIHYPLRHRCLNRSQSVLDYNSAYCLSISVNCLKKSPCTREVLYITCRRPVQIGAVQMSGARYVMKCFKHYKPRLASPRRNHKIYRTVQAWL